MTAVANCIIKINNAHYLNDYRIEFEFHDHKKRIVDFENFLKTAKNPMLKKYLDLDNFKNFALRNGDIDWNDYDLCFPIADLYEGHI